MTAKPDRRPTADSRRDERGARRGAAQGRRPAREAQRPAPGRQQSERPAGPWRPGPALLDAAVTAVDEVLQLVRPADRVLSAFFRAHPQLGQQDRAFVAETVYAVLRRKRLLEAIVGGSDPRRLVLAALTRVRGFNVRELAPLVSPRETEWLAELKAAGRGELPLAVRCDLPDWVAARLEAIRGREGLVRLAEALNRPAPLDLRVNVQKADRETVLARLAAEGIAATPTPYSPVGVRLAEKPALARHPLFLEGAVEVQDEGSQLLSYLVAPRRGEMVVDFCAGAGGKALALGALMRSTGRVYAFDVSERRLAELKPRLARSGLSNLHPQRIASERDPRVKRLAGKIDRVLVDAPCSGLGTLRRNPDLKWRQGEADVARMSIEQGSILASAAGLVKPGGRLVYATCSLLPEENEAVVSAFLAAHPEFRLLDAAALLRDARIDLPAGPDADRFLRLSPDTHATDGFFAAVMERAKGKPDTSEGDA